MINIIAMRHLIMAFFSFLEAYSIFLKMQRKNELHHHSYFTLIKALLAQDYLQDAIKVKRM